MRLARLLSIGAAVAALCGASGAHAQYDPYIGQLLIYPGNFCPQGWAHAEGQILSVAQNPDLFAAIGSVYGGNGTTTFGLPDMRGRAAAQTGQGPKMPPMPLGKMVGQDLIFLSPSNLPSHTHTLMASTAATSVGSPAGAALGVLANKVYAPPANASTMIPLGTTGITFPMDQHQPSLGITHCIALQGKKP